MVMIGSSGVSGHYGAAATYAQLIGINTPTAALAPESSLVPVGQTTTFRTGGALGQLVSITDTLSGTPPIAADSSFASFEIVAGTTAAATIQPGRRHRLPCGMGLSSLPVTRRSSRFSAIGGLTPTPNLDDMSHLTSFNLIQGPEPSTLAWLAWVLPC